MLDLLRETPNLTTAYSPAGAQDIFQSTKMFCILFIMRTLEAAPRQHSTPTLGQDLGWTDFARLTRSWDSVEAD